MKRENGHTPLAIIGAGPGGYAAAFLSADMGMEVTVIDPEEHPGGVCLYRGCIPTKALLHACAVKREIARAKAYGITAENPGIDIERLRRWKDGVVKNLTSGLGNLVKRRHINYIRGRARFRDARSLLIDDIDGNESTLSFERAIIATGSVPSPLPGNTPDSPLIMHSEAALDIIDIPGTLLVIGGGYIGLELGTVYADLGSRVTIVEMAPQLLPGSDKDLLGAYLKSAGDTFERILTGTTVTIRSAERNLLATLNTGDGAIDAEFDKLLIAIGRTPATSGLGLENTGVELDDKGFIKVDRRGRTSEPSIYATGDVTGPPLLAHKATHEGRTVAENIAGKAAEYDPRAIPAVEYTDPEIAWTGITETEASGRGIDFETAVFPWAASGRAATLGRSDGLTKLILEKGSGRLLGAAIVGAHAGELISEATLGIEMGAVAQDLALTIHPHPTLSETIMEAAEVFEGSATDIYRSPKYT